MVAAGFLPVCYHKGKLLFLFGLEGPMEKSAKGWSDFAGGLNSNEKDGNDRDIYKAALREMSEEIKCCKIFYLIRRRFFSKKIS